MDYALKHKLTRITKITLHIGEMAGVVAEALEFAFESVSIGTIAEEAELVLVSIKATAECGDCGGIYEIGHLNKLCPVCHTFMGRMLSGTELTIQTIEGESS